MYQAFLSAAEVEEDRGLESVTRVLLIGSPTRSDSEKKFIQHLCNNDHNMYYFQESDHNNVATESNRSLDHESHVIMGSADDHHHDAIHGYGDMAHESNLNNAWKHRTLPLCIHVSKGISNNNNVSNSSNSSNSGQVPHHHHHHHHVLEHISTFLKQRNYDWTFSSWLSKWQVLLRKGWLADQEHGRPIQKLSNNRVHVVWLCYSPQEAVHVEWARLKDELAKYQLPVQIVITNDDDDSSSAAAIMMSSRFQHESSSSSPSPYTTAKNPNTTFAEHNLQKNFLEKRGFLFPNVKPLQHHFIIVPPSETSNHDLQSRQQADSNHHHHHHHPQHSSRIEDPMQEPLLMQQRMMSRHHHHHHETSTVRQLTQLEAKELWASAEVIKTIANIQQTAKIICNIVSRLGKRGTNIAIAPFMMLPRSYTLAQSGIFMLRCLCKIWEVPKPMEMAMLKKLAAWELGETSEIQRSSSGKLGRSGGRGLRIHTSNSMSLPRAGPGHKLTPQIMTPLSLGDGRYLHFSVRVAAVILYCKAHHPKGWIRDGFLCSTDYVLEFDSFYAAYQNQFDEFAKNSHFGISAQILQALFASSHFDKPGGGANLKQQLQTSLEDFFVDVLNRTDFTPDLVQ